MDARREQRELTKEEEMRMAYKLHGWDGSWAERLARYGFPIE